MDMFMKLLIFGSITYLLHVNNRNNKHCKCGLEVLASLSLLCIVSELASDSMEEERMTLCLFIVLMSAGR